MLNLTTKIETQNNSLHKLKKIICLLKKIVIVGIFQFFLHETWKISMKQAEVFVHNRDENSPLFYQYGWGSRPNMKKNIRGGNMESQASFQRITV